ncbi:MAG: J domain-containing protein [Acaryochloridaceae cyanobacterium SU_2_1]|nr:J domain-containing protein [Acaryochloridaceae cyanobacterium SU_2_1]NJM95768.1 J domain-containing protein [Acaryochloridaceae cyanobacterium CSU_5_19]
MNLSYYRLLDLSPQASRDDIHRAYRQKSKLYHPDTTELSPDLAAEEFQRLHEAYATLSNPEGRRAYDRQLGLEKRLNSPQGLRARTHAPSLSRQSLVAQERPLSPGELFALLILALTFMSCLVLAIVLGIARGEMLIDSSLEHSVVSSPLPSVQLQSDPTATSSTAFVHRPPNGTLP